MQFNYWKTGLTIFSKHCNFGVYLEHWEWPYVRTFPGSTYCPNGIISFGLGPFALVLVR
jgi:hypothetical protein